MSRSAAPSLARDQVAAIAALIAPVTADLGRARIGGGVVVVAVEAESAAVAVGVRPRPRRAAVEPRLHVVAARAQGGAQRIHRADMVRDAERSGGIGRGGLVDL